MKNYLKKITVTSFLLSILIPLKLLAATSATIYVTPSSSSVNNGNNVTVSVRINPNSNPVDSVQATLNFDSSKLQYLSYSAGSFTTFQANASSNTFSYVGTLLASSTSVDSLMFSVTFKSISDGSASLTLSGVSAAYQGNAFSQTSVSNGSVTVSTPTPPSQTVSPPKNTTKPSTTPTTPQPQADTTAPSLVGEPSIVVAKNSISLGLKTSENAKIFVRYILGDVVNTFEVSEFKTDHSFVLGQDSPLSAGTIYKIEIDAEDASNNKAMIFVKEVRTTGVDYNVKITDLNGIALSNHKVQLFSDPQEATTDENGIAKFTDVNPGEHTLVFEIDGLVLRKTVLVGSEIKVQNNENQSYDTVKIPVRFQDTLDTKVTQQNNIQNYIIIAVLAIILGIIATSIFFLLKENGLYRKNKKTITNK